MPWTIFLSAGTTVASTPPSAGANCRLRRLQNNTDTTAPGPSSARLGSLRNQTSSRPRARACGNVAAHSATFQNFSAPRPPPRSSPPATSRCREKRRARPTPFLKSPTPSKSIPAPAATKFSTAASPSNSVPESPRAAAAASGHEPGVRNDFFEPRQKTFAQFLPPESLQVAIP